MNATLENNVFESIGVFNTIYKNKKPIQNYNIFAANKLKDIIMFVNGIIPEIKNFTIEYAKKELEVLNSLEPEILQLKKNLVADEFSNLKDFKIVAIQFVNTFEKAKAELEEALMSSMMLNSFYNQSMMSDWNHPDNDHWDTENY